MAPRVSVNICCYNSERYLEATLQSVFAQTFTDWELVIVNDGSTDGTGAIIRRHLDAGRPIAYLRQANRGLSASRNEALRRSSGALIAFLDHDDLWEPEKLARQVPLFDANPRVGIVYSDCVNFTDDGFHYRQFEKFEPHRGRVFGPLLRHYFLNLQTVVVRRAAIDALPEWFDERFHLSEEADLFLRIAYTWELDYVAAPLARWRLHASSSSRTKREQFPREMTLLIEKLRAMAPEVSTEYARDIASFELETLRLEARVAWEGGRRAAALRLLAPRVATSAAVLRDFLLIGCCPHAAFARMQSWARSRGSLEPVR